MIIWFWCTVRECDLKSMWKQSCTLEHVPFPRGVSGWVGCGRRAETWECSAVCKAKWCSDKLCHSSGSEETPLVLCLVVSLLLGKLLDFSCFGGFFVVSSCASGHLVFWWGMWSLFAARKAPKWRLTQSCARAVQSCPTLLGPPGVPQRQSHYEGPSETFCPSYAITQTKSSSAECWWGSVEQNTLGKYELFIVSQPEYTSFLHVKTDLDGCHIKYP